LATNFVDQSALAKLRPEERARLQLATRQFADALATLESLCSPKDVHPSAMLGPLTDYLVTPIRVKGDYERPVPVLERLREAPGPLWMQLRGTSQQWIRDLRELRGSARGTARSLASGSAPRRGDADARSARLRRAQLVRYIVASSQLHRWLESGADHARRTSRARRSCCSAVCEMRIDDTFWLSQADFYLETAIRRAPGSEPRPVQRLRAAGSRNDRQLHRSRRRPIAEGAPRARLTELRKLAESR
jgi:hypothetical protein